MPTFELTAGILGAPTDIGGRAGRNTRRGEQGIVMFGPYESRSAGRYRVDFVIDATNHDEVMGDPACCSIEVVANDGKSLVVEKFLLLSDLLRSAGPRSVEFTLHEARPLEYRVQVSGQVELAISSIVEVTELPPISANPHPLDSRERRWLNEREFLDGYLRNVSGVIHVGANLAQERRYYWLIGVNVFWVEAIPEMYARVVDNIARYPKQRAVQALLTDRVGDEVEFQIANNNGASSSILPLEDHATLWPGIQYVEVRKLTSTTLTDLMKRENISANDYQALTLDIEGAELLALRGAVDVLPGFEYVKCEVADFPARTGTPSVADLDGVLTAAGFSQLMRRSFAQGPNGDGTYWDIVWKRNRAGEPLHEPGYALPMVVNPDEVDGIEKCE